MQGYALDAVKVLAVIAVIALDIFTSRRIQRKNVEIVLFYSSR